MDVTEHLKFVENKARGIAGRLSMVRRIGNAKLLINLFRMFVVPSFRLLVGVIDWVG